MLLGPLAEARVTVGTVPQVPGPEKAQSLLEMPREAGAEKRYLVSQRLLLSDFSSDSTAETEDKGAWVMRSLVIQRGPQ